MEARELRSGLRCFRSFPLHFPVLFVGGLVFGLMLTAQTARKMAGRKLIVISIAGLDERFLTSPPSRVKIPNILRMMRQGSAASGVVGVVPSETWPSQIALMTGVPPAKESGARDALWNAATKGGLKVASVYWPGTLGAEIAFDLPAVREPQRGQNLPFDDVAQKTTPAGLVDQIEKTGSGFEKQLWDDDSVTRAAVYLLKNEKPDLLLVNFPGVASEELDTGALSIYARDQLENEDVSIGQILAAMQPGTDLALVSGNGFENENYIVRPRVLLKRGGQPEMRVEVEDGLIGTADRDVAERLRKLMMDGHRHGLAREVPMAEVKSKAPSLSRWVAAFDTPQNYVATADANGPALGPGSHMAVNGLWPIRPGYRSVFMMSGEGIPAKNLGSLDLLQVAPTLADAIGVKLPDAKGKSVWPMVEARR